MARRRSNGEGTLYKRKDGRWCASLATANEAGKIQRRTVYGRTQAEVKDKLTALKRQQSRDIQTSSKFRTVGDWLDIWLSEYVKPSAKPRTHETYEIAVRLHLKPRIGSLPLLGLKPRDVDRLTSSLRAEGKSARIAKRAFETLRCAMNCAVKKQVAEDNPCRFADSPSYKPPEAKYLDREAVGKVLSHVDDFREGAIVTLALTTGMRLGELLGLQWDDVDFGRGTVTVKRTQQESRGVIGYGSPKSNASRRTIALESLATDALESHRAAMFAEGHDVRTGLVFVREDGKPIRRCIIRREVWIPLLKMAGVDYVAFHCTRHTNATLLLTSDVHPKVASARLGHSRVGTTLDIYSHVVPALDEAAAAAISATLAPLKKAVTA